MVRTPRAEQDLEDIFYYISLEFRRRRTAEQNVPLLREKCANYRGNPLLGQALSGLLWRRLRCERHGAAVDWMAVGEI